MSCQAFCKVPRSPGARAGGRGSRAQRFDRRVPALSCAPAQEGEEGASAPEPETTAYDDMSCVVAPEDFDLDTIAEGKKQSKRKLEATVKTILDEIDR